MGFKSAYQHVMLAIITSIDTLITGTHIKWSGLIHNWLFAGIYAINTYIAYRVGGKIANASRAVMRVCG